MSPPAFTESEIVKLRFMESMYCRLFQRLRKDYPNIFKVSRTFLICHPSGDCFITFERV